MLLEREHHFVQVPQVIAIVFLVVKHQFLILLPVFVDQVSPRVHQRLSHQPIFLPQLEHELLFIHIEVVVPDLFILLLHRIYLLLEGELLVLQLLLQLPGPVLLSEKVVVDQKAHLLIEVELFIVDLLDSVQDFLGDRGLEGKGEGGSFEHEKVLEDCLDSGNVLVQLVWVEGELLGVHLLGQIRAPNLSYSRFEIPLQILSYVSLRRVHLFIEVLHQVEVLFPKVILIFPQIEQVLFVVETDRTQYLLLLGADTKLRAD